MPIIHLERQILRHAVTGLFALAIAGMGNICLSPYAIPADGHISPFLIAQVTEFSPNTTPEAETNTAPGAIAPASGVPPGFISPTTNATESGAPGNITNDLPAASSDLGNVNDIDNNSDVGASTAPPPIGDGGVMNSGDSLDATPNMPDATSIGLEGRSSNQSILPNSPLRLALSYIHAQNYPQGIQKLDEILKKNPSNAQALYLRAVAFTMVHRYHDAEADYKRVVKCSSNLRLRDLAEMGLSKLKE